MSEFDSEEPPRRARRIDRDDRDDDRYDDRRDRRPEKASNGMAVAALVLGILSLLCAFFAGIPAMICGFIGLSKAKKTGVGKGMALTGLVLGGVGTVLVTAAMGYGLFFSVSKVKEAAGRQTTTNNMKQIGLGVLNYHDSFDRLPPPDFVGVSVNPPNSGPPDNRLSWRVAILPNIEQDRVYRQMTPQAGWSGNKQHAATKIKIYADPEPDSGPDTRIRAFVGKDTMFPQGGGRTLLTDDGTSNTILAVEAADKVPWPQYNELPYDPNGPLPKLGRDGANGFVVLMADGSVKFVRKSIDPKILRAAITANGREDLPVNWFE